MKKRYLRKVIFNGRRPTTNTEIVYCDIEEDKEFYERQKDTEVLYFELKLAYSTNEA